MDTLKRFCKSQKRLNIFINDASYEKKLARDVP